MKAFCLFFGIPLIAGGVYMTACTFSFIRWPGSDFARYIAAQHWIPGRFSSARVPDGPLLFLLGICIGVALVHFGMTRKKTVTIGDFGVDLETEASSRQGPGEKH